MIKNACINLALCLGLASTATFADEIARIPMQVSNIPTCGFFAGLGGSYNSIAGDRVFNVYGESNVMDDTGSIIASGSTQGPNVRLHNVRSSFAPEAEAGYFTHFTNRTQLWGLKLVYRYLNLASENHNVTIPQIGRFTSTVTANTSFPGNVVISSSELNIDHELVLAPFIGQSFANGFAYIGAGPSLFSTHTNHYGTSGEAVIEGFPVGFANVPNSSYSEWIWGSAAELGITYFICHNLMLDFSYSYAITGIFENSTAKPFSTGISDVTTFGGTVNINTSQQIIVQTFQIALNIVF